MSDYGFATYDEKTGRISEKINSKYPVFGPEYRNISVQYRTIHINDTKQNAIKTASLSMPSMSTYWDLGLYYGESYYTTNYDELVYSYKHGFSKRPMGYAIITGTLVRNTRTTLSQDNYYDQTAGGDFTVNKVFTTTTPLAPSISGIAELNPGSTPIWETDVRWVARPMDVQDQSEYIIIPNACHVFFTEGENVLVIRDQYTNNIPPYRVVITDTEVKIYRNIAWTDHIVRLGDPTSSPGKPPEQNFDIRQRTKGIEDYAGSSLDITIYLVPYSLGDLS